MKKVLDKWVTDLDMIAKTKGEIVRHLARLLMKAGYIQDLEGYTKDAYLQESEGTTGIGDHVTIPHEKSDYVDHVGLAVGRTRDMVEWESYGKQPSDLFFLFAVPVDSEGVKDHLRLIVELTGKLGNDSIMTKLQTTKSYDELLEAFA